MLEQAGVAYAPLPLHLNTWSYMVKEKQPDIRKRMTFDYVNLPGYCAPMPGEVQLQERVEFRPLARLLPEAARHGTRQRARSAVSAAEPQELGGSGSGMVASPAANIPAIHCCACEVAAGPRTAAEHPNLGTNCSPFKQPAQARPQQALAGIIGVEPARTAPEPGCR